MLVSGDGGKIVPTIKEGPEPQAAKELLESKPPMDVIAGVGSDSCPSICGASGRRADVPNVVAERALSEDSAARARYMFSWLPTGAAAEKGPVMAHGIAGDNIFIAEA